MLVFFRQIFDVVVAVFQRFHNPDFVHGLGGRHGGGIFGRYRAEHAESEGFVDLVHGDSFEFRNSPAPVGVCDHVALETFSVHEAAQEEIAHNLFTIKNEKRKESLVPDDL